MGRNGRNEGKNDQSEVQHQGSMQNTFGLTSLACYAREALIAGTIPSNTRTSIRTNGALVGCVDSFGHVRECHATGANPHRTVAASEPTRTFTSEAIADSVVGAFVGTTEAGARTERQQS